MSIGLACNFYKETNAIHGLLETASQFFDDLVFISSPPSTSKDDDETIDVIKKWGARLVFSNIDSGFGAIRTEALHASNCEWVMIMDADERFFSTHRRLKCNGSESWDFTDSRPNLTVDIGEVYNQGEVLKSYLKDDVDCVVSCRRHWFDFSWKSPTQNWHNIPDSQCRILRNKPYIGFKQDTKMHEQVADFRKGATLRKVKAVDVFHDHFHCFFKPMEKDQRSEDIAIYDALDKGLPLPCNVNPNGPLRIGKT